MITYEQREKLHGKHVLAALTRKYKPRLLPYELLEGTLVVVAINRDLSGVLLVEDKYVDWDFPYDAAELLE